ncbi:oligosaccharide flippase family protein [Halovivax gelatinilyticus]|uniref:oligosaccharide flippase family protein n=1 Tax=Halovivax gelatinilyticus TaxID=2961597 RepID=UPI0020CA283B|nr:oligosaccharide flippase family protein [Halovivax gelatinilyticus]
MPISTEQIRDIKASFVARIVHTVTNGLLVVALASYLLGPDEYGLLFLVLSILVVAQVFADLGVSRSAARYVSEYKETDPGQVPHIVRVSLAFRVMMLAVVCLAVVLARPWIAAVLDEPALASLLVVGVCYLAFKSLTAYHVGLFQGFSRLEYSAAVGIVDNVGRLVFVVGFVALGFGVVGALAGYVVGAVLATALGLAILYWKCYRPCERAERAEPGLKRRILEYSVPLTASESANVVDRRVDILLVGFFLTPAAVGFYTLAKQITEFVEAPAGSVGFALSPAYGEEKARDRLDHAARIYETSFSYVLLLYVPAAVGMVLLAEPGITIVFGDEYAGAVPVLQILSLFVLFKAINSITTQSIDYLGRARTRAIVKGITAAGNVALNIVLIPTMGLVGAAIATVVTFGAYTLANVAIMHAELPIRTKRFVGVAAGTTAISILMGFVVLALAPFISGYLTLFGVVGVGVGIWAALVTATGLVDLRESIATFV